MSQRNSLNNISGLTFFASAVLHVIRMKVKLTKYPRSPKTNPVYRVTISQARNFTEVVNNAEIAFGFKFQINGNAAGAQ
jgi:hypothetical protein